ncbi:ATP-binding protein [Gillisia sp. M10.2A]|uniref:histidine kinase n=1 Tax=Gillisia lutea TaxID=2909668 RepID=A0ABS9EC60_9FLAO|nr:ATP-binding protein [Gillisia lutea]MCF4100427.1 ATP-binding protein [Gillisia lutea]
MKNTKRSITFKVIIGYLLVAALAAMAVWFIYTQVVKFSSLTQSNTLNNQQLVLVSEIATELYETENTGRRFIQSGDETDLNRYSNQIKSIQNSLDSLKGTYADETMKIELDSISLLLSRKGDNLEEILQLRSQDRNTNYYKEVIQELQKVDESFNEPDYENRFSDLEPHQRRVLIQLLEFSQDEEPAEESSKSTQALVASVKNVLSELEKENQRFREVINKKENELLENDMVLNQQLRKLLSVIEQEERETSLQRVENSQNLLEEVSRIIIIVGVLCILIILFFLFLIVRDVSRSQQYRIKLEEAQVFTESLMKRREQFMATITHDLRSPLNTVMGYTDLIEKSGLNNKQEHYLGYIKKSSEYILHLVNDLLDLSKLEAGKMLIEYLPFNPKNLVEETLTNIIPINDKKNLKVVVDASEEADCKVISDPFRIKQILSNLISNAYKFTESGGITATVALEKEIGDAYTLLIRLKDTGIGISKERQEEIFEEFSQEHGEIEKKYGGTGLGLAITKRITKLLHGSISLKSEPGKGSEFLLKIPVKKVAEDIRPSQEPELPKIELNGRNILIADDEASQLALTKELIRSVGMNCDTAKDGEEAIAKLVSKNYQLVITDIQMPNMDGFQLVKAIRTNPNLSEIPVIAVSGRTNVSDTTYIQAGFTDHMLKPYKPRDFLLKIGEVLKVNLENHPNTHRKPSANDMYSLDEILLFTGDDPKALDTILKALIDSTKINIKEISYAHKQNDSERIAQIAHRMLPMFKQLRADDIVRKLELLEIKKFNLDSKEPLASLLLEIEVLLEALNKEIKA